MRVWRLAHLLLEAPFTHGPCQQRRWSLQLVRATLIEGISRYHGGSVLDAQYRQIAKRRGRNKARVALARKVLTLVYYGLRDGEIRCLAPVETAA